MNCRGSNRVTGVLQSAGANTEGSRPKWCGHGGKAGEKTSATESTNSIGAGNGSVGEDEDGGVGQS
jgi:hypothetical protein